MKNSERNLMVLQNFILHITHSSKGDFDSNTSQLWTANELYKAAQNYIEEDHVDGKGNLEDEYTGFNPDSFFYNVLKPKLVQMVVNDEIPSDLTQLHLDDILGENSENTKHLIKLANLGECISLENDHDGELEKVYQALAEQSKVDGSVMADDVVTMWEKLEYAFTVDQLLEHIS